MEVDLEELVRQAIRSVAFRVAVAEREVLLRHLSEILENVEYQRSAAESLFRFGALD